jgi:hypothetical protein
VTSFTYLNILRRKTMEKAAVKEIRARKKKYKENRQAK